MGINLPSNNCGPIRRPIPVSGTISSSRVNNFPLFELNCLKLYAYVCFLLYIIII